LSRLVRCLSTSVIMLMKVMNPNNTDIVQKFI
jgi:LEA14-like dessication related protein